MARKFIIAEIRFFFDVEEKDIGNLANRLEIIKRLRKLRKESKIPRARISWNVCTICKQSLSTNGLNANLWYNVFVS